MVTVAVLLVVPLCQKELQAPKSWWQALRQPQPRQWLQKMPNTQEEEREGQEEEEYGGEKEGVELVCRCRHHHLSLPRHPPKLPRHSPSLPHQSLMHPTSPRTPRSTALPCRAPATPSRWRCPCSARSTSCWSRGRGCTGHARASPSGEPGSHCQCTGNHTEIERVLAEKVGVGGWTCPSVCHVVMDRSRHLS